MDPPTGTDPTTSAGPVSRARLDAAGSGPLRWRAPPVFAAAPVAVSAGTGGISVGGLSAAVQPGCQTGVVRLRIRLLLLAAAAVGAVTGYVRYVRPWQLTWGATSEEVSRPLPGDELVARPTFNATRAISIAAAPGRVWPWLLQVGLTRAGWYSYDILDNLGRRSARRIVPELQGLAPGTWYR